MARFGRMFEVKGEMRDIKEVVPDDKQTGGKTSKVIDEELDNEGNKVGFEDWEFVDEENDSVESLCNQLLKNKDGLTAEQIKSIEEYFFEKAKDTDFKDIKENELLQRYADYVIAQYPNINKNDADFLLIYSTRNEANRQGILNNIVIEISDKTAVGSTKYITNGEQGPISKITFSEKELIDGVNNTNLGAYVTGVGHLIEASCHEVEHAKQNYQIYSKEPILDYEVLRMAKENLVSRVSPDFYKKNYRAYVMEKNAFLNGREQSKKALEKLKGVLPEKAYAKIENRINLLIETDRTEDTSKMTTSKTDYSEKDNADFVLTEMTDSIMEEYTEDALEKYSILSYQYNSDGSKKSIEQLYQERDSLIAGEKDTSQIDSIKKFYEQMIEGDRELVVQKEEYEKNIIQTKDEKDVNSIKEMHKDNIYKSTNEYTDLEFQYSLDYYKNQDDIGMTKTEYIGQKFGEIYQSRFDGDKKEMAKMFAMLEQEALANTMDNYNESDLDNQQEKYLLAMSKVTDVPEYGNVYVATYEMKENEEGQFKPLYEYYTLNEDGTLEFIESLDKDVFEDRANSVLTQAEISEQLEEYVKQKSIDEKEMEDLERESDEREERRELKNQTEQEYNELESAEIERGKKEETGAILKSVNGKSIEELTQGYREMRIGQSDLENAYGIISRTKEEREQLQTHSQHKQNKNDFEGR